MEKRLPYSRQDPEVRKGPWTMEEDSILINYIANHGKGFWNSLAKAAGLKRTGKSCRLRWLNYLRPDVRRGNITPDEQLLIIELQAKWGNRWSKIAKYLPGRTDNEIKNFWRTRIQKHVKQLQETLSDLLPPPDQTTVDPRHASTAQTSGLIMTDNTVELSSPLTAFWHDGGHDQMSADHHHAGTLTDVIDVFSPPAAFQADHDHRAGAFEAPAESNKSYWGMEGLWSMQLLNDD